MTPPSTAGTPGTLILAGAPIGAPGDAPARLRDALAGAEVVAAEDTRRLQRLARDLGVRIAGRVLSYFDANEGVRTPELLAALLGGQDVLLVTDAGMPSVSDPGYRLVTAAAGAGVRVTALAGPSAVTTALAVSGLPCDRFCFEGFPPRRTAGRRTAFQQLAAEPRTMVFFEAPHRLAESLADMAAVFGADRHGVVCRELTKTHEEVRRGPLAELAAWAADGVRGEVTVVLAGATGAAADSAPDQLAAEVARREDSGEPRKQAIADVARDAGVAKRVVYDAVLTARQG
ncbi:MAG: 16S rRNA (cytidine(1402)-2'-O)-methyltransferase [Pseudonocardiales bacterium]